MTSPFLLYRLPNSDKTHRLDFTAVEGNSLAFGDARITPWATEHVGDPSHVEVCRGSTREDDYLAAVGKLVENLGGRHGKTVIQRTITGHFSNFDPFAMADEYFGMFPGMFCFLFYHPIAGWWMGASPELLLQTDDFRTFNTRALAGTRPRTDKPEPWSEKNIEEHLFVVRDILADVATVNDGLLVTTGERADFRYGSIEHLCTPIAISGNGSPALFDRIAAAIHPTAAVCGMPRAEALTDISTFESEARKYYGGTISVTGEDGRGRTAYVVLRCVHFDSSDWCVYTGSGITEASQPDDELDETERKASPLTSLLSRY